VHRVAGVSLPRGNGKSYAGAAVDVWRLLCGKPPPDIISAALDFEGAKVVLEHAPSIVCGHVALSEAIEVRADGLYVPPTGSRWTVTSARSHRVARPARDTRSTTRSAGHATTSSSPRCWPGKQASTIRSAS
jgi:hypothetical protein